MVQLVNPAQNALNAFGQVKNIQYREDQEEFLEQKREDYKVDREFTLEERERLEQERELKRTFAGLQASLYDENGNLDETLSNELVTHEALSGSFLKRAQELTGRDDIEEMRVIQADGDLIERFPDLKPGQIVPLGRTKDGKVIPLVDQETGEAFLLDSDEFAGVITGAAAEAGQFEMLNSIIEGRRQNSQREAVADVGRGLAPRKVNTGQPLTDQPARAAAQGQPGAGGAAVNLDLPDNDLADSELAEELEDTNEEIAALEEAMAQPARTGPDPSRRGIGGDNTGGTRDISMTTTERSRPADPGLRGAGGGTITERALQASEPRSQGDRYQSRLQALQKRKADIESRIAGGQPSGRSAAAQNVAAEERALRNESMSEGQKARAIRARLKQTQQAGKQYNASVDLQNDQINRIADLAESGAIDASTMFDMIDTIRNPDVDTTTTQSKDGNWIITSDNRTGREIHRIPVNPNGAGLSAEDERKLRKDQLAQGRKVTDRLVDTLGLEQGSDRARAVNRLASNTTALLDPNVMNIDGTMMQAVNDMDAYIDNNDGIWAHVVDFFGGAEVPEAANQRDLMPFILARSIMPEGENSPTTSALDSMQDQVDLVRDSLKDSNIPGAAVERTAFTALAVLAQRGASEAQINSATKRLSDLIKNSPEEVQRAASMQSGALALADRINRQ